MFVPCGDDGNVLEKPKEPKVWNADTYEEDREEFSILIDEYQKALDRVIFDGFKVICKKDCSNRDVFSISNKDAFISFKNGKCISHKTLENLVKYKIKMI